MRRNRIVLAFAGALIWFAMYSYVPTLPAYAETLGADAQAIGIISGVYGILQMALRTPLGIVTDRVRRDKILLITGFGVLALSGLLFVMDRTVEGVILARTTAGGAAAWWVVITAAYANCFEENRQVKAQGILQAFANGGKVAAAAACAVAAQFFGYMSTFWLSFAGGAAGFVLMFTLKTPPAASEKPASLREQLSLFKNRDIIAFSVLAILSQMQCFALPTTFAAVAAQELGADSFGLGVLVVIYFIAVSASSAFVGSKGYRKMGGRLVLALSFLCGAAASVPFLSRSMPGIWISQVLAGVMYGVTQAQLAGFVIRCAGANQRAMASGIYQTIFSIGIFGGPVVAGALAQNSSMDAAWWFFAAECLLAAVLCPVLVPRRYSKMT